MIEKIKIEITPQILLLISELDEFKGAWMALGNLAPEILIKLKKVATIESIGSSTRIEGNKLTDKEIEILLSNIKIQKFGTRDEQEVAGYAELMNTIFTNFDEIELSERYIQQLHGILLKYSDKDNWHKGQYKKSPNHVVAVDKNGKQIGIIFETTSPFETPLKMQSLINWVNKEFDKKEMHPLLIISIFIVSFLAIHPFQDGNGRLSRAITTILLLRTGYNYVPYSSLESVIEQDKKGYYLSLRQTQSTIRDKEIDWNSWIIFFLKSLKKQKDNLEKKISREHIILTKLPEISQFILDITRSKGTITIGQVLKLSQYNRNTIKKHLDQLVKLKKLKINGTKKGAWYTLEQ